MGLVSGEIGGPVHPTLQPRSASKDEASSSGVSAPLAPCSIAQRGREHPGGMPSERPARRDRDAISADPPRGVRVCETGPGERLAPEGCVHTDSRTRHSAGGTYDGVSPVPAGEPAEAKILHRLRARPRLALPRLRPSDPAGEPVL